MYIFLLSAFILVAVTVSWQRKKKNKKTGGSPLKEQTAARADIGLVFI